MPTTLYADTPASAPVAAPLAPTPAEDADLDQLFEAAVAAVRRLFRSGELVIVAYSGGKDSTAVLIIALAALQRERAAGHEPLGLVVLHNDTTIENPEVHFHARGQLEALEDYAFEEDLPVVVRISGPSLAARFVPRTLSSMAIPRFATSGTRDCTIDWKIRPAERALKALLPELKAGLDEALPDAHPQDRGIIQRKIARLSEVEMPVTLVGTRTAESSGRARRMAARGEQANEVTENRDSKGKLHSRTVSPIMHWEETEVWELLSLAGWGEHKIYPAWTADFEETITLYRDSGGGECVIVQSMKEQPKAACGARHGCAICLVAGEEDKSLAALIDNGGYDHLKGLHRLRSWILNTRYDWDLRRWLKRKNEGDAIAVGPDAYSGEAAEFLLRAMASLDVQEVERARRHADLLAAGRIPERIDFRDPLAYEKVVRLTKRQFHLVTAEALVAIDFLWAVYGIHRRPFHAFDVWFDVAHHGNLIEIPEVAPARRQPLPKDQWLEIPGLMDIPAEGLRLDEGLADDGPLFGEPIYTEEHFFTVDVEKAKDVFAHYHESELKALHDSRLDPTVAAQFWLANRIVKPKKGSLRRLDERMKMTQRLLTQGLWLGMLPAEVRERLTLQASAAALPAAAE